MDLGRCGKNPNRDPTILCFRLQVDLPVGPLQLVVISEYGSDKMLVLQLHIAEPITGWISCACQDMYDVKRWFFAAGCQNFDKNIQGILAWIESDADNQLYTRPGL